ncbi:hypothetical protein BDQ17DRAFT_1267911, partial [Cyathus striatus]
VEKQEQKQGAQRGPSNESLKYFHDPTLIKDKKGKCWQFKCHYWVFLTSTHLRQNRKSTAFSGVSNSHDLLFKITIYCICTLK